MDQEKIMLVEKLCQLKKELVKQEEKAEFFEEHIAQLTEDIQGKSRCVCKDNLGTRQRKK